MYCSVGSKAGIAIPIRRFSTFLHYFLQTTMSYGKEQESAGEAMVERLMRPYIQALEDAKRRIAESLAPIAEFLRSLSKCKWPQSTIYSTFELWMREMN